MLSLENHCWYVCAAHNHSLPCLTGVLHGDSRRLRSPLEPALRPPRWASQQGSWATKSTHPQDSSFVLLRSLMMSSHSWCWQRCDNRTTPMPTEATLTRQHFAQIQALTGGGQATTLDLLIPLLGSLGSLLVGGLLVVVLQPHITRFYNSRQASATRDSILLAVLFLVAALMAFACRLVGSSDLLGCFLAGLLFSSLDNAEASWHRQVRRDTCPSCLVQWCS